MATFGLVALILLAILVFALPRQYVILPFLLCICYLTYGVALDIAGLNLMALRVLAICGFARVVIRGELSKIGFTKIDGYFLAWAIVGFTMYSISHAGMGLFVFKSALTLDALCMYFCFRSVIRDFDDIKRVFRYAGIVIIPLSAIMLYEHWTMRNIFSAFGGADEFSYVREGKVRCQGPFRHPILAGMMGATVMPFIVWQWWREKRNSLPLLVSFAASAAITYAASSSGALLTFIYEILAFSLWFIRDRMKMVRWSIVVAIIGLDFAMTAPIWYVFARLSSITGGTGWHRAYLLERAFGDIERWWFAGTAYTADWFPYILEADANNADITNMFLVQGVTAGMITMILFIMIIVQCYKYIGAGLKALNPAPFPERFLLWTLGVVLFGHIAGFFSVSYFDQMNGMWYLILAMISSAGSFLKTAIVIEDDQPVMIEGT